MGIHETNGYCPSCMTVRKLRHVRGREEVEVRGETFRVEADYYACHTCKESFEIMGSGVDTLDAAYRLYRRAHGMIQPEQIVEFRKSHDLTQREFAALMGWGDVTLSRYENGALQDEAHDKQLRLVIRNPSNLASLIEQSPEALAAKKRDAILARLAQAGLVSFDVTRLWANPPRSRPCSLGESFSIEFESTGIGPDTGEFPVAA